MSRLKIFFFVTLLFLSPHLVFAESNIKWEGWSDSVFARAKKENKLVYLNLEAIWCHWCHVMEEKTYSKKEVADYSAKSSVKLENQTYAFLRIL